MDYPTYIDNINYSKKYVASKIMGTGSPFISSWRHGPVVGAIPTTAEVCDSSTTGAFLPEMVQGTNKKILAEYSAAFGAVFPQSGVILCDRLAHSGGLLANSAGVKNTNLPTPPLTRYTTGEGVMMAVEIYTQVGNTATTITASYTNQDGVSGRTSKSIIFGGAGNNAVSSIRILPLQDGDTGVQSVQSLTQASTTLTAGNYGVTLFKPILMIPNTSIRVEGTLPHKNTIFGGGGMPPVIENNACLFFISPSLSTTSPIDFYFKIIEE